MTKTKKLQMELPKEGRFISSEFPILRENLGKIDQALADVEEKVESKAPSKHTHSIGDVADLEAALEAKMAADKTFSFADLRDIEGAQDAANNYVLYKSSNNNFTFGSAVSLLGAHQHRIDDIVGLDEFRAKLNEGLTSYGRLTKPNEWQGYNKFTSKVTMSDGLELLGNSSLNLTHNNKVITSLSTSGSTLKGPLKVDGEAVYTKSDVDNLTVFGRLAQANEWWNYNKFHSKVTISDDLELLGNSALNLIHNDKMVTSLSATGSLLKGPLKVDGEAVYTKSEIDKLIALLAKKPFEILITQSGPIPFPEGVTDNTDIEIQAWGAGGGGGGGEKESKYTNLHNGGGGEGGQCTYVKIKGWQLKKSRAAQIGRGGEGVYGNRRGSKGGDTFIDGIIRASGGSGGYGGGMGGSSIDRACSGSNGMYGNGGGGGSGYFSGKNAGGSTAGSGGNGAILLKFYI